MRNLFFLLVLAFGITGCRVSKNFYTVEKDKAYRSAQLTREELALSFQHLGIKTVINLRGAKPQSDWYKDEVAVTAEYGVNLVDIGMSARRLPHRPDLLKLLATFETAPRPILIHCKAGADRTGEAAALYQMLYMNKPKAEALKMLNIIYGHIQAMMPAKIYFVKELWQGADWAREEYDPCGGSYKYYDPNNPVCNGADPATVPLTEDDDT
jgi:protein tyrosine/serine phosphatase